MSFLKSASQRIGRLFATHLLQLPRPDVKRLNHLLKQEAARAELGIDLSSGRPPRELLDELTKQSRALVTFLWNRKHSTSFDRLVHIPDS